REWRDPQHGLASRHRRPRRPPHPGIHLPMGGGRAPRAPLRRPRVALDAGALSGPRLPASDADCGRALSRLPPRARRHLGSRATERVVTPAILTLAIRSERDVVLARQRARQIAAAVGLDV